MSLVSTKTGTSFCDDLMFCSIVQKNTDIAKGIIERVTDKPVADIKFAANQKSIKPGLKLRGVRFDVTFSGDDAVYDVEMQTCKEDNLLKRARYYTGMMDVGCSKEGMKFDQLRDTHVIFLEMFDQFGYGEYLYPVERTLTTHPEYNYQDGVHIYFVNAEGKHGPAPKGLKEFLSYLRTKKPTDDFTRKIDNRVTELAKDPMWRYTKMLYEDKLAESKKSGIDKMKKLTLALESAGRLDELPEACKDPVHLRKLFAEFGIK